eukprot:GHVT01000579.1.p1 GENE.GHVT01000579.1~~GHVT01000579.1.p1  ORF type:complete len:1010 (+),score=66.13 GHVT01000579.1:1729-4758(+)
MCLRNSALKAVTCGAVLVFLLTQRKLEPSASWCKPFSIYARYSFQHHVQAFSPAPLPLPSRGERQAEVCPSMLGRTCSSLCSSNLLYSGSLVYLQNKLQQCIQPKFPTPANLRLHCSDRQRSPEASIAFAPVAYAARNDPRRVLCTEMDAAAFLAVRPLGALAADFLRGKLPFRALTNGDSRPEGIMHTVEDPLTCTNKTFLESPRHVCREGGNGRDSVVGGNKDEKVAEPRSKGNGAPERQVDATHRNFFQFGNISCHDDTAQVGDFIQSSAREAAVEETVQVTPEIRLDPGTFRIRSASAFSSSSAKTSNQLVVDDKLFNQFVSWLDGKPEMGVAMAPSSRSVQEIICSVGASRHKGRQLLAAKALSRCRKIWRAASPRLRRQAPLRCFVVLVGLAVLSYARQSAHRYIRLLLLTVADCRRILNQFESSLHSSHHPCVPPVSTITPTNQIESRLKATCLKQRHKQVNLQLLLSIPTFCSVTGNAGLHHSDGASHIRADTTLGHKNTQTGNMHVPLQVPVLRQVFQPRFLEVLRMHGLVEVCCECAERPCTPFSPVFSRCFTKYPRSLGCIDCNLRAGLVKRPSTLEPAGIPSLPISRLRNVNYARTAAHDSARRPRGFSPGGFVHLKSPVVAANAHLSAVPVPACRSASPTEGRPTNGEMLSTRFARGATGYCAPQANITGLRLTSGTAWAGKLAEPKAKFQGREATVAVTLNPDERSTTFSANAIVLSAKTSTMRNATTVASFPVSTLPPACSTTPGPACKNVFLSSEATAAWAEAVEAAQQCSRPRHRHGACLLFSLAPAGVGQLEREEVLQGRQRPHNPASFMQGHYYSTGKNRYVSSSPRSSRSRGVNQMNTTPGSILCPWLLRHGRVLHAEVDALCQACRRAINTGDRACLRDMYVAELDELGVGFAPSPPCQRCAATLTATAGKDGLACHFGDIDGLRSIILRGPKGVSSATHLPYQKSEAGAAHRRGQTEETHDVYDVFMEQLHVAKTESNVPHPFTVAQ